MPSKNKILNVLVFYTFLSYVYYIESIDTINKRLYKEYKFLNPKSPDNIR